MVHEYAYDELNRLESMEVRSGGALRSEYLYTVALSGMRLGVNESRTVNGALKSLNRTYAYDNLGRLVEEDIYDGGTSNLTGTAAYDFDAVGNRISREVDGNLANVLPTDIELNYTANDWLYDSSINLDQYDDNGNTIVGLRMDGAQVSDDYDLVPLDLCKNVSPVSNARYALRSRETSRRAHRRNQRHHNGFGPPDLCK